MPKRAEKPKRRAARRPEGPLASLARVEEHTLSNGLRVRLAPSQAVPTVSYYTFFRVGARNERPGITGISHLFEHMMFNGTQRYPHGQFDKVLEAAGGYSNAYTTSDITVYHEDIVAESLEQVVDLEADRMRSLAINDKVLEAERQVVIEERQLRVDNEISGMMDEELDTLVWKAHPYRWPVIGWRKDIERISREDCMAYFRTYYAPNNATVFVAGDFEPKKVLALIKRYYGSMKKGPVAPEVADAEPDQRGERRALVHHPAQAPSLMIGYRAPKASEPDALVLDVLQYVLAVGQTSRLVRELVFKQERVVSVTVDWSWRMDPGVFVVFLELKPGQEPAEAEGALYRELDRVGAEGITDRELDKARNNLKAHLLRELATNGGRANAFGTYEMLLGSWRDGLALPKRYDQVTAAQVKAVAARYLDPRMRSVVTLKPTQVKQ